LQGDTGPNGAPFINSGFILSPGKNTMGDIRICTSHIHARGKMQTLSLSANVRAVHGFFSLKLAAFWFTLYHGSISFVSV
jgi:hypothetical protein